MSELYLVPVGEIQDDWAATAADCIAGVFGLRGVFLNPVPIPKAALDPKRAQYSAPVLLEAVIRSLPRNRTRALALTSCDIFIPMLTFLFGQAQLGGRVALVSTARLQPQFYGLPPNPELVAERLRKETYPRGRAHVGTGALPRPILRDEPRKLHLAGGRQGRCVLPRLSRRR